jgi:hypothetical protein
MEPGKQSTPSASYATQHYESALKDFGSVDADKGLSDSEALRRRCTWGSNEFSKKEQEPLWVKFLDGFKDPLILLLFGAAAVSLLMGQIEDGVSIASVSCPAVGRGFPSPVLFCARVPCFPVAMPRTQGRQGVLAALPSYAPCFSCGSAAHLFRGSSLSTFVVRPSLLGFFSRCFGTQAILIVVTVGFVQEYRTEKSLEVSFPCWLHFLLFGCACFVSA